MCSLKVSISRVNGRSGLRTAGVCLFHRLELIPIKYLEGESSRSSRISLSVCVWCVCKWERELIRYIGPHQHMLFLALSVVFAKASFTITIIMLSTRDLSKLLTLNKTLPWNVVYYCIYRHEWFLKSCCVFEKQLTCLWMWCLSQMISDRQTRFLGSDLWYYYGD